MSTPPAGERAAIDDGFTPTRVSVIIPCYNAEEVLPAQLRALAQQDYTGDWEILVADNNSTDGSRAIAGSFAPQLPNLRLVDASGVQGPSHARNAAVQASEGDLLLFCDADDVVAPDWVSAFVGAAGTADLLAGVGIVTRRPEQDNAAGRAHVPPPSSFRFLPWNRTSNLAVRREAFERVGGFDEQRLRGEDADLCWRVQLAGYRFRFVPEAFVAFRDWDTPRTVWARQWSFGKAAPGLYADFADQGAPPESARTLLMDFLEFAARAPGWLLSPDGRLRAWAQLAGLSGRCAGMFRLRFGETERD